MFKILKKYLYKLLANSKYYENSTLNSKLLLNKNLIVGKYTYGLHNVVVRIFSGNPICIQIGSFVSISSNCEIITGGIHPINWISTFPLSERFSKQKKRTPNMPSSNGPIVIGSDVWIASNVTILSGVTIGDGVVIAANSLVTKDLPAYSVAAGVPAKVVKYRFEQHVINRLLEIKWWDWDDEKIEDNIDLLSSVDVSEFLLKYGKIS